MMRKYSFSVSSATERKEEHVRPSAPALSSSPARREPTRGSTCSSALAMTGNRNHCPSPPRRRRVLRRVIGAELVVVVIVARDVQALAPPPPSPRRRTPRRSPPRRATSGPPRRAPHCVSCRSFRPSRVDVQTRAAREERILQAEVPCRWSKDQASFSPVCIGNISFHSPVQARGPAELSVCSCAALNARYLSESIPNSRNKLLPDFSSLIPENLNPQLKRTI